MLQNALLILRHEGPLGLAAAIYGLARAEGARLAGRRRVTRRVHGYRMELDLADRGLSRTLILFGKREREHQLMLERALKPGMTVFDIGANIGYYVLMERRLIGPEGRIVALEPSPDNLELLHRNLALNGVRNVTVLNQAVSDRPGRRRLHLADQSNLNTFHATGSAAPHLSGRSIEVDCTTVPELSAEFGAPDLIRMDVEGHEVEVLGGMIDAVSSGALMPLVLFETHLSRYGPDHDLGAPLRRLFACGYRARLVASSQESGTARIEAMGYRGGPRFSSDMTTRAIFEDIADDDALTLICQTGGVRAVLLAADARCAGSTS
ncbi:MAG: FkbM family methyltransferase [Kiloniellales bacterium]